METLLEAISIHFRGEERPDKDLVVWDGYNELEKHSAVDFYAEKTWQDVLAHLNDISQSQTNGGAYYLEEWSVLSTPALLYFARAHLEHLYYALHQLDNSDAYNFVVAFFHQLYQVIHVHKTNPFDREQTQLLEHAALLSLDKLTNNPQVQSMDIVDVQVNINQFRTELTNFSA